MLNGKLHRARVTGVHLDYVGSITIDETLLQAADILPNEAVHVVNLTNGHRIETYTISGKPNSGVIEINGAAAHLFSKNDLVIIMSYVELEQHEITAGWKPSVILLGEDNLIAGKK
jgi:aspartate 1-decarboxylase